MSCVVSFNEGKSNRILFYKHVSRQLSGAMAISQRTAKMLRSVVTHGRYPDHLSLLADIKKTGIKLQEAKPSGSTSNSVNLNSM